MTHRRKTVPRVPSCHRMFLSLHPYQGDKELIAALWPRPAPEPPLQPWPQLPFSYRGSDMPICWSFTFLKGHAVPDWCKAPGALDKETFTLRGPPGLSGLCGRNST